MKNYKRRLMITSILLINYALYHLTSAGMLIYVCLKYSNEDELLYTLVTDHKLLIGLGMVLGVFTGLLYLAACISGILAARGRPGTDICKATAILLIIILVIDVMISVYSIGLSKKVSRFIVKMIILKIYYKAAKEVY